jgi:hypothetical protein
MTDTVSKTDAVDLAHTYHWFMRDLNDGHDLGVCIYGDWLLSMQERMGVELIDQSRLADIVAHANERYEREAA